MEFKCFKLITLYTIDLKRLQSDLELNHSLFFIIFNIYMFSLEHPIRLYKKYATE
jgi:hypothetical protein